MSSDLVLQNKQKSWLDYYYSTTGKISLPRFMPAVASPFISVTVRFPWLCPADSPAIPVWDQSSGFCKVIHNTRGTGCPSGIFFPLEELKARDTSFMSVLPGEAGRKDVSASTFSNAICLSLCVVECKMLPNLIPSMF